MSVRSAEAEWKGDLPSGSGTVRSESGALDGSYSFASRFEEGDGTNPEELVAAAHAGCYAMALSHQLAGAGHAPDRVRVAAKVHLERVDGAPTVTRIELVCRASVPGIDEAAFLEHAEGAKVGCPISKALSAVAIELDASLI